MVHTESFEYLPRPFTISRGFTLPVRSYDFVNWKSTYAFGQQRKMSGTVTFERGGVLQRHEDQPTASVAVVWR